MHAIGRIRRRPQLAHLGTVNLIANLIAGCVLGFGCGKSDEVAAHCDQVCTAPATHPCATRPVGNAGKPQCVADCKAKAGVGEQQGFKKTECGLCVANQFAFIAKVCREGQRCTQTGTQTPTACEPAAGCTSATDECLGLLQPQEYPPAACTALCIDPDA